MLKVVGASWLQTRISTYILVAVALLGVGAIILGEFGRVENDGTYSATVSWNYKGGYRVDFLGQSNDLASLKLNVARAYYKTGIFESGWSIVEIETSSKYPDTQQAYAAGLLEGSLTWQLIHHHWHNTINAICERRVDECRKLMQFLRENTAIIRERAELLEATDPFWHMVRLFYIQLDGLEAGWRFGVRRSRQSVEMDTEHFLWLAMAADLPDLELVLNASDPRTDYTKGTIFLKSLPRENLDPLLAVGHTTSAPYAKMLRLLKKFTFGYHVLPMPKSAQVPGRSIVMSSYPGALSSHDELYLIRGQSHELIVVGTPLTVADRRDLNNFTKSKNQVMSSVRVMAANRLAINGRSWSHILSLQNGGNGARQWVTLESRDRIIWLIEQLSSGIIRAADISERFAAAGVLCLTGKAGLREIAMVLGGNSDDYEDYNGDDDDDDVARSKLVARLQKNITTAERFSDLMRGYSHEDVTNIAANELPQILAYRGDLEKNNRAVPFGVIDSKIVLVDVDGMQSFEATSGPSMLDSREPFCWSKIFPNVSHIGQPDVFNFGSVTPLWVWV